MSNPLSRLIERVSGRSKAAARISTRRAGPLADLERVVLYKYLASRVRAGHDVGTSLEKLLATAYLRKTARLKAVLTIAIQRFHNGAKLAESLNGYIPQIEHLMVMTGDQSGSLPATLAQLVDSIMRDRKMRRQFRKSLTPSVLLLAFGVAAIFGVALYVVPQYRSIVNPSEVHGLSAVVFSVATPVGIAALVTVIGLLFGFAIWLARAARTVDAPWRRWIENIPNSPFAFYRDWMSLIWLRMHLIMLKAGVLEREALQAAMTNSTPWLARRLALVKHHIERTGKKLPAALVATYEVTNFPAPLLIEEIEQSGDVADTSGALEKALAVWEEEFVETAETNLRVISAAIKFAVYGMLFLIAGAIGSLIIAVLHQSLAHTNMMF
jgi:type II secretory pathway component PulF